MSHNTFLAYRLTYRHWIAVLPEMNWRVTVKVAPFETNLDRVEYQFTCYYRQIKIRIGDNRLSCRTISPRDANRESSYGCNEQHAPSACTLGHLSVMSQASHVGTPFCLCPIVLVTYRIRWTATLPATWSKWLNDMSCKKLMASTCTVDIWPYGLIRRKAIANVTHESVVSGNIAWIIVTP